MIIFKFRDEETEEEVELWDSSLTLQSTHTEITKQYYIFLRALGYKEQFLNE